MNAAEQLRQQGEQRGMQKGMQKGMQQQREATARHLLFTKKRQYTIDEIVDITGLDETDVERLKDEQE